jgi:hypothetical protein
MRHLIRRRHAEFLLQKAPSTARTWLQTLKSRAIVIVVREIVPERFFDGVR